MKNIKSKWKTYLSLCLLVLFIMFTIVALNNQKEKVIKGTLSLSQFWEDVKAKQIETVVLEDSLIMKVIYKEEYSTIEYLKSLDSERPILDKDLKLSFMERIDRMKHNRIDKDVAVFTLKDKKRIETTIYPQYENFVVDLSNAGLDLQYKNIGTMDIGTFVSGLFSFLLSIFIVYILYKTMRMMGTPNLNKNYVEDTQTQTKFIDIAGMTEEKEELMYAIKSLKDNKELVEKGAKPIRGILLEGPPGVGKTLLAKAVAGEAGVPFLSYSGSDFVELFVGLGASRVREMYRKATQSKPCVVFIDEIDALGRARDSQKFNSEADQTLVALLEKMDGKNTVEGILFIAATNRVDTLDKALLRPGRFDKIIHVGLPRNKEDREAIVEIHLKGKTLEEGISIEQVAKYCFGLTGAEIYAVLNDAVFESFRGERKGVISLEDIDKAMMKLRSKGIAKGKHSKEVTKRVAVHELGHALVQESIGRKIVKVAIQPYTSGIGGITFVDGDTLPTQNLCTEQDLRDEIKVLLAGRVAEEIILGSISVGAQNDLERATLLVKDYVGTFAMSSTLLAVNVLDNGKLINSTDAKLLELMEEVIQEIYKEVKEYISQDIVKSKINKLLPVLVEKEVLYDLHI